MTLLQRRAFVALDEWGGILLLVYLHRADPSLFWLMLGPWAVLVYVISYPWLWEWEKASVAVAPPPPWAGWWKRIRGGR